MTGYTMNLTDEVAKKVFSDETYKIIEENKRLKLENAQLKEELDTLKIRSEIRKNWVLSRYLKDSKHTSAKDYVISLDNREAFGLYINLTKHYGYTLVDEIIESMIKEAQEEKNENN